MSQWSMGYWELNCVALERYVTSIGCINPLRIMQICFVDNFEYRSHMSDAKLDKEGEKWSRTYRIAYRFKI